MSAPGLLGAAAVPSAASAAAAAPLAARRARPPPSQAAHASSSSSTGVDATGNEGRVTRMKWLYNTITAYGTEYEFSDAARQWIKERVATADVSSRRDRRFSTWWEDSSSKTPSGGGSGGAGLKSAVLPVLAPSAAAQTLAVISAGNAHKLSLTDVLSSASLLSDVKDCLEDVLGSHNLEFLEAVQCWLDDMEDLPADAPRAARDTLLFDGAVSIYSQYLDRATARDNLINVPDDVLTLFQAQFALVNKTGRGKCGPSLLNPAIFDPAVAAVRRYVEDNLWPDFVASDDYTVMCISAADTAARAAAAGNGNANSAAARAAAAAASKPLPASRCDYNDTVPKLPYPALLSAPLPSWDHAMAPFNSITVTVSSGRGPMASMKGNNQLYVLVTAGSCVLRGAQVPCMWGETFSLPVAATLQCVTVAVCLGTKLVGFIPINMSEVAAAAAATAAGTAINNGAALPVTSYESESRWYALRDDASANSSSSSGSGSFTSAAGSALDTAAGTCPGPGIDRTAPPSGRNEVLMHWSLSQVEPVPVVMQPDNVKAIYVEESATGGLGDFIRNKVSKKKKRFTDDNFNLDLTYITPQVIAMGFPSEGAEGVYRNPLKQVQQFFKSRHPNAYRIYNLCSERAYDPSKFEDRVRRFPFDDHNPPPFTMIKEFCEDARAFLAEHPQNAISVHCKAGKGRTGTMIACLFVYLGLSSAHDALMTFGRQRTSNSKGVTIPSQIRYVHYFDNYCALRRAAKAAPGKTTLFLQRVLIRNIGRTHANSEVFFTILEPNHSNDDVGDSSKVKLYSSRKLVDPVYYVNTDSLCWELSKKLVDLNEDFRVEFAAKTGFGREKMFQCWLNTRFMKLELTSGGEPRMVVPKRELDKACKDIRNKRYPPNMYLELVFGNTATATKIKAAELTVTPTNAAAAGRAANAAAGAGAAGLAVAVDGAESAAAAAAVSGLASPSAGTTGVTTEVAEEPI